MIWIIIPVVLILIIIILLPPSLGRLPKGHSLSEKTTLEIDGAKLGLILLSDKEDNPVLLVCGGGPGIPQYLLELVCSQRWLRYYSQCKQLHDYYLS